MLASDVLRSVAKAQDGMCRCAICGWRRMVTQPAVDVKQTTNFLISETTILQMAAPSIRLITTSKAPPATGHSQAVLLNNQTLYISGQTGIAAGSTNVVPGGARAEAKQAHDNIGEILTYAGSSFKHVINCNIMVADMSGLPGGQRDDQELLHRGHVPCRERARQTNNRDVHKPVYCIFA
ncbi:hypothetical protein niasHT_026308 [Heterodera trifolii]|uniref:Uncharacterized protein n=1 Tax=Heterodera trifolii TaxID=157864 RepID=A0ABD2JVA6_9BILA